MAEEAESDIMEQGGGEGGTGTRSDFDGEEGKVAPNDQKDVA